MPTGVARPMKRNPQARTTKRLWLLALIGLVTIAAIACGTDNSSGSVAQVGAGGSTETVENAPPITGETFAHGEFSLELNEGKPVLVNFWFPSCPPCKAELPDLQAAYEEYGDQVAFIGIQQLGVDAPASGAAFLEDLGITYPTLPDTGSTIQYAYEVFQFPTTMFLDNNHDIARRWTGGISAEDLAEQLEILVAG